MDLENEDFHYSKLKTKGKNQTYIPKLEYLELKPRTRRQGKCVGAALEYCDLYETKPEMMDNSNQTHTYNYISNDIWFHLANYIAPEDVQNYALICSQSANSVNSCQFWLQLYRRYCQQSPKNTKKCILQLREYLQIDNIKGCDRNTLRQRVVTALFFCYAPLKERLKVNYSLESLEGCTYVSSWYSKFKGFWFMCYKFKMNYPLTSSDTESGANNNNSCNLDVNENNVENNIEQVDDWQWDADYVSNLFKSFTTSSSTSSTSPATTNDLDGVRLLAIRYGRFTRFSPDIVYNIVTSPFRLAASRKLLVVNYYDRSINLELDFISSTRDPTITIRHKKIQKIKVLPWWHPLFKIFSTRQLPSDLGTKKNRVINLFVNIL